MISPQLVLFWFHAYTAKRYCRWSSCHSREANNDTQIKEQLIKMVPGAIWACKYIALNTITQILSDQKQKTDVSCGQYYTRCPSVEAGDKV